MKSAYFVEKNKMEVREFPKAQLVKETDAIIKIVRACVCGSDLWWFRGISERQPGRKSRAPAATRENPGGFDLQAR